MYVLSHRACRIAPSEPSEAKHVTEDDKESMLPTDVGLAWESDWPERKITDALRARKAKVAAWGHEF